RRVRPRWRARRLRRARAPRTHARPRAPRRAETRARRWSSRGRRPDGWFRAPLGPRRRSSAPLLHVDELDLAEAPQRAHLPAGLLEARTFVDLERPFVERGDGEDDPLGLKPLASVLEPRVEELEPMPLAGQIGAQTEPVLQQPALELEVVEADHRARSVMCAEEPLRVAYRLVPTVVEVVRRAVRVALALRHLLFRRRGGARDDRPAPHPAR